MVAGKVNRKIKSTLISMLLVSSVLISSALASANTASAASKGEDYKTIATKVSRYYSTQELIACENAWSAYGKNKYIVPLAGYGKVFSKVKEDGYYCSTTETFQKSAQCTGSGYGKVYTGSVAKRDGLKEAGTVQIYKRGGYAFGQTNSDKETCNIDKLREISSALGEKDNDLYMPDKLGLKKGKPSKCSYGDGSGGKITDSDGLKYCPSTYPKDCKDSKDVPCYSELSASNLSDKIQSASNNSKNMKLVTELNGAENYYSSYETWQSYCGVSNGSDKRPASGDYATISYVVLSKDKKTYKTKKYYFAKEDDKSSDSSHLTGYGAKIQGYAVETNAGKGSGMTDCGKLAKEMNDDNAKKYAEALNNYYRAHPSEERPSDPLADGMKFAASQGSDNKNSKDNDTEDEEDTCSKKVGAFGWVVCPGGSLLEKLINNVSQLIANAMEFNVLTSGDNSKKFQEAWQKMLIIANIIFAIAFMLMIQSMATKNIGVFSNYDVKKMLPRLIICAVAVNLSFYICAALVDLSNLAGKGVYTLIMSMVTAKNKSFPESTFDSIVDLAVIILFVLFGLGSIVALFIVYIALLARQIVLTMLIIISPIAFALYLLPNTEQWFKKWFNAFTKLLLVYPMFTAVWSLSVFFSNVFNSGNSIILDQLNRVIFTIIPAISIVPIMNSSSAIMSRMSGIIGGATAVRAARSGLGRVSGGLRGAAGGVIGRSRFNPVRGAARKFGNSNFMQNHDLTRGAGISMANWGMKARADRQAKLNELQSKSVEYAKNDMIDRHFTEDQRKEIAINGSYTDANNNIHKVDTAHQIAAMQEFKGNLNNNELEQFVVNMPSTRDGNGNLRDDVMSVALRQAQTDIISNSEFVSESDAESIVNNVGSPNNSSITNLYNAVAKKGGNMSTDKLAGMSNSDLELFTHAIHNATDTTASARAAQSYQNLNNVLHDNSNPRIRNKMSEAARNTISQNAPGVASIGQRDASAHMNLSETTNRVNEGIRQRRENEQRISELQNQQSQANNTAARSSLQGEIDQLKQSNAQIDSSIMNTVNNFRNSVGSNLQENRYYSQLSDTDRLAAEQIFNTSSPTRLTTEIVDSSQTRNKFESRYRQAHHYAN